jgi:YD repeat-containing protein
MFRILIERLHVLLALLLITSGNIYAVNLPDLAPPKIQLVDEFGVNVHSGQVQSSLETVSIGGAMGLSHSISNYTNNFSISGYRGYQDKFFARGVVTEIDTRPSTYKNVLRVHDISGSADFQPIVGGVPVNIGPGTPTNYIYSALGDKRHSLERRSDGVYWTKPDGTVVIFEGSITGSADQVGQMKQIRYPNGFTIYVDYLNKRVTTNTGFALKYIHQYDPADSTLEPAKAAIRYDSVTPRVEPEIWASRNPKYVQAINTSVENCLTSNCVTNWPKAEFKWPAGMPRAIFLGDSTFRVTDATGGVTEYYFRSFDLAYNGTNLVEGYYPYQRYSPRLIGIKPAGSSQRVYQYTYKNIFDTQASDHSTWFTLSSEAGQVTTAKRYEDSSGYTIGDNYQGSDIQNIASSYIQRVRPKLDQYPGAINSVTTREGQWNYEISFRNFPAYYVKYSGMVEEFGYDTRGNMNSHKRGAITVTASYPASCNTTNFKYCNSPTWTRDGKGNQTDYVYHADSGQVEKVTYPANKNGIRAETRYTYEQKYANYYTVGGTKTQATIPVWLKTAEKYCINSNALNGVCAGNDEVVTRYEYQHDNLFLTGMTVTDPQGKTLRTCYQYDIYGNRIGETQPKANLTSCN